MIPGFKTGPRNWDEGRTIVTEDGASMCEVWFDVSKKEDYREPLQWLLDHDVKLGLHHWGLVDGILKTNLSCEDSHVRETSLQQVRETIDFASDLGCVYVNAHPGAAAVERMDFTTRTQSPVKEISRTPSDTAEQLLLKAAHELTEYATSRGMILTLETLPGMEARAYEEREGLYDPGNTSLTTMQKLAESGISIANDITHTAGAIARETSDRDEIFEKLMEFSEKTRSQTKLLHVNTVVPPFDGTDSHTGITDEDFALNPFPTKDQLIQWLSLYTDQDTYAVLEPATNMRGNYKALVDLLGPEVF